MYLVTLNLFPRKPIFHEKVTWIISVTALRTSVSHNIYWKLKQKQPLATKDAINHDFLELMSAIVSISKETLGTANHYVSHTRHFICYQDRIIVNPNHWLDLSKMQLDIDIEPTLRFPSMKSIDKQMDQITKKKVVPCTGLRCILCTVVYNSKSGAQCTKWCTNVSWTYKVVHKWPNALKEVHTDRQLCNLHRWAQKGGSQNSVLGEPFLKTVRFLSKGQWTRAYVSIYR